MEEEIKQKTLEDISTGGSCVITKVHGHGGFRHRILEMGFVKGQVVSVIRNAPLQDPIEYKLLDSYISLRRSEARQIEVVEIQSVPDNSDDYFGTLTEEKRNTISEQLKTINVALLGNPNCGKTSFFNFATGMREKTGNYSGVTVSAKTAIFKHKGYTINLVDLPGTYSITEYTPEEMYVRQYLTDEHPDVVLNIIDGSNLERNLFLTTQLIDMNVNMVAAINMYDELEKKGNSFDYKYMEKMLGFPFVPTTAYKGIGINEVLDAIIEVYEGKSTITKHIHINYGNTIEEAISKINAVVAVNKDIADKYHVRYLSIKLLEGEKTTNALIETVDNHQDIKQIVCKEQQIIANEYKEEPESVIANAKYAFIRGALKETFVRSSSQPIRKDEKIDNLLTNRWLGFPILIIFLWIMFQTTFTIGAYPQEWLEIGVNWLGNLLGTILPEGIIHDLLINGVVAGVGGVIVFLPNIIILFLFISLMEDTGYMARATFILDKLMHKMGLHGRSFIPLLTGFGCSVPAIMACRTLENKKDRTMTMLLIPFMSCSAKLPVYILIVSAFFTKYQGLILLSIYLIGIMVAIAASLILKKTIFRKANEQFVMELPPYRMATLRNTIVHVWSKTVQYLKKMGSVILIASIVIWALNYFPRENEITRNIDSQIAECELNNTIDEQLKIDSIAWLTDMKVAAQQEKSCIGYLGKFIEPVMRPLGFDWKMSICILTGFAAKETVVSSMNVLYPSKTGEEEFHEIIRNEKYTSGKREGENVFTPIVAFSFMIFILLYCPCVATIAACRKESSRKWAIFMIVYTTAIAWIVSFAVYQIGTF